MPKARAHRLDADDDDILQDGESITVRATLMDEATLRELRKRYPPNNERLCGVTDWAGKPVVGGGKPGFLYPGISDVEYDSQLARLSAKVDELGRTEEVLVGRLMQESPLTVTRRLDAEPQHVLGVIVGTAAARRAA